MSNVLLRVLQYVANPVVECLYGAYRVHVRYHNPSLLQYSLGCFKRVTVYGLKLLAPTFYGMPYISNAIGAFAYRAAATMIVEETVSISQKPMPQSSMHDDIVTDDIKYGVQQNSNGEIAAYDYFSILPDLDVMIGHGDVLHSMRFHDISV